MNTCQNISRLLANKKAEGEMTRMELMAGDQQVPYQSELFEKGINQFQYNMDQTLDLLSREKIPVFLSNLVSNIKDLPPFISNVQESNNAMHYYRKAQSFYLEKDYQKAKECYIKAKELDLLRFRAPEELNTVIKDLCDQYPNTYFVDAKTEMEEHAPHHLLGNELFTDHVHPNLKGYALLANAFYTKIMESQLLPKPRQEITEEQVWHNMPVSPIDSIAGEFRIMKLKGHWPFKDTRYTDKPVPENTIEEKLAAGLFRKEVDWLKAHDALYNNYIRLGRLDKAAKIADGTVLEYTADPAFYEEAAMVNGQLGNTEEAAFYLKKSFGLAPTFEKARYLTVFYLMMDDPKASLPFLDYAIAHNNSQLKLDTLKPMISQVIGQEDALSSGPANTALMNEIASTYLKMDNQDGALKYISMVLQIDPGNHDALNMKRKLK
jgi:tetratricopeptide (TPR) repeat protein